MKVDTWMPLYVGDYLADTTRLSTEQHGAYLLLIMDYWRNGPPPDDDAVLSQICRAAPAVWKRIRPVLVPFFSISGGQWKHKRIDAELAKATKIANVAHERGIRGASARWHRKQCDDDASSNASSNAASMPQAMLEQCLADAPSPSPLPKEKPKPIRRVEPDGFCRFWDAYPRNRRVAKAACLRRWVSAGLEGKSDVVVGHVRAMADSRQWQDGYNPAPLTYLNQRRWEDGLPDDSPNEPQRAVI